MVKAVLALALAGLAVGQPSETRIREVRTDSYPNVEVVVSVEGWDALQPPAISVRESGRRADITSIRPLASSGERVDVVLAIDTSHSMGGEPLRSALSAAREFAADLPPWVRVGAVTFAKQPHVLAPLSADREPLLQAVGGEVETSGGTALFAGIREALGMFSGKAQRNVVVLSDGHETSRSDSATAVARAAREADATIYTIGLARDRVAVSTLTTIADETSGAYVAASEEGLSAVYQRLAGGFAQQFVVVYRTTAPPGTRVRISVQAAGGSDSASVVLPAAAAPAPSSHPLWRLIGGPVAFPALLFLWFVGWLSVFSVLLGSGAQARRIRDLAARILGPSSPEAREERRRPAAERALPWIPEPLAGAAEQLARVAGLNIRLDRFLERASVPLRTGEFVVAVIGAALLGAVVGGAVFRNALFAFAFALMGGVAPVLAVSMAASKRQDKLHQQLPDVLMVLASSLRAGHSFLQGLDMVAKEVGDPAAQEFTRAVTEIRLGRPVDDALNAMAERVRSDDFKWAVLAINVQRQVGGNLAEVLETVAETIRERDVLRRQVKVLSAEGRLSVVILMALPPAMVLYFSWVTPQYIATLFGSTAGLLMVGAAGLLMAFGFFVMRRIIRLDV